MSPQAQAAPVTVQLVLVSHTNIGKTTLTRTLLGEDVGEVRDAAHVTQSSQAHTLLSTPVNDQLQLWDTPGFGDSVRLLRRLPASDNALGWFLREVFDRYRDRPFWLSQQAVRTARDTADVVLYLVSAGENPRDAGYLDAEMRILAWLGKPVVVLLNQVGPPRPAAQEQAERALWRAYLDQYPLVRNVLALDAFARCWVHERGFYDAVGALLPPAKTAGYARLLAVWSEKNQVRFVEAMRLIGRQLAQAASDQQAVAVGDQTWIGTAMRVVGMRRDRQQRRHDRAMQALMDRLEQAIAQATAGMLALYRINPGQAAKINARVRAHFLVRAPIDRAQAGLLGAVISGATTGLTAELVSGGATMGLGALVGSVVGALTFAGAAWGFNTSTDRQHPNVRFTDEFLRSLLVAGVLRYLAVIHFGRGRGRFVDSETPAFWQSAVEHSVAAHEAALRGCWQALRDATGAGPALLDSMLHDITRVTLRQLYPEALHAERDFPLNGRDAGAAVTR